MQANAITISNTANPLCLFMYVCMHLFIYLKYQFQSHSDGALTINKANYFCFFPTLQPIFCSGSKYVGYEIPRKRRIALWQCSSDPLTVIYLRQ